ncbi:hypothetical protein HMPREF1022_02005 [Desulfovibrio sp. 6_1_46AFAA]|nr:hypothetical protein HMPREF0326_01126 [Desulfovibrio sp. 3_1_syn3]EGW50887.1 hypothetical protein HMPREF1022_02005 [Desulfovibrio sp. 6_1_46AFAA]GKG93512.1 hypothetical protein CE91St38_15200 [Desulfovibrionaceae bacterium]GKI12065.1 hypothetical protein CE91St39_15190 [Desulfovibrionaceae bacterium]
MAVWLEFMNAQEIFRSRKNDVVRLWTEAVYSTYPFETTGFLRTKQDAFGNPVANMTKEAAGTLYDAVAGEEVEVATVKNALERFVKLRAVQTFTPSQGLGVFYLMKPLLRERILPELAEQGELDAYLTAESRLDSLALLAFDIYTAARETLAESRIKEIRNQYAQLARWAQTLEEGPSGAR